MQLAVSEQGTMKNITLYQGLMGRRNLAGMTSAEAMEHMGRLRDIAYGLKQPDGIHRSIELGKELDERGGLRPIDTSRLNYFISNAWEKIRLLNRASGESSWSWEQPEIEKQVIHLKRAINREALKDMSTKQVCQVLSNMGALLNHVGRFSEAIEYWDRAVSFKPDFALGRGKRGYALTHYARVLYDSSHSERFLKKARADLKSAVSGDIYADAHKYFSKRLAWVESTCPASVKSKDLALFKFSESSSAQEVTYRRWCLENRLFLNPLNDLGPYPAAMRDDLNAPNLVTITNGGHFYHGIFNQMKQAFVSARYLYYEGITAEAPHFSDKDVMLFDTMDYPSYSLSVEKTKAAFTMAYSIFDKLALLINYYMNLDVPEEYVTFRSIWYQNQEHAQGLRKEFHNRKNWALRGLFWLSKDLHEDQPGFDQALEPDAREFAETRHNISHRYLKLHEDFFDATPASATAPAGRLMVDSMAMSMKRGEFEARVLRMLKKIRSAMMYVCFAIHLEEKARTSKCQMDPELPAMSLSVLDDSWKV